MSLNNLFQRVAKLIRGSQDADQEDEPTAPQPQDKDDAPSPYVDEPPDIEETEPFFDAEEYH